MVANSSLLGEAGVPFACHINDIICNSVSCLQYLISSRLYIRTYIHYSTLLTLASTSVWIASCLFSAASTECMSRPLSSSPSICVMSANQLSLSDDLRINFSANCSSYSCLQANTLSVYVLSIMSSIKPFQQ